VNKCFQTYKRLLIERERDFTVSVLFRHSRGLSCFKHSVVLYQSGWCQTASFVPKNTFKGMISLCSPHTCSLSFSWMQFLSLTMIISEIQSFLTTAAVFVVTYFFLVQHLMQTRYVTLSQSECLFLWIPGKVL